MKNAIVLLSGGLDSTTVLAYAQSLGFNCHCISFDYGQLHSTELKSAANVAKQMDATEHLIFKIPLGQFGGSSLTDQEISVPDYANSDPADIPNTYVPARNITFLSIALSFAETRKANDIFIGVSEIDYSGYPDCRPEFIESFTKTANLATKAGVTSGLINIHSPLVNKSKAQTILMGTKLGVDYSITSSCYRLTEDFLACGKCDACQYRKQGFAAANIPDPTRYVAQVQQVPQEA